MKGKIYKLFFENDIYIGSTFDKYLSNRLGKHRDVARKQRSTTKLYKTMYEKGANNFIIELLEEYECKTKEELRNKEDEWITKLTPSLNTNKSKVWTEEYYKVYQKEYHKNYIHPVSDEK